MNLHDFTPTQQKILLFLADGMPHNKYQVLECIDEQADMNTLRVHLTNIRKILRPIGEDIICEVRGYTNCYRHVRLLASAVSGYS